MEPAKNRRPHAGTSDAASKCAASTSKPKTPLEAIESIVSSQYSPDNTVTLLVGPKEQKMIAHGSQLTHKSEFFKAAMKKEWAEGQTRTIKLPEEKPDVAAHYLSYLYSGKLFTEDIKSVPGEAIMPCFELLASLYVSCERYLNKRLQVAIITEILRLASTNDKEGKHWIPTEESVRIIYHGTPEGSPARRLLVDLHIAYGEKGWFFYKSLNAFQSDMLVDMHIKVQRLHLRVQDLKVKDYT